MGVLDLNLYRHPSGVAFDPAKVIRKARAAFPEAEMLPGDQLAAEALRAEGFLADDLKRDPAGPASHVVNSLRRKAAAYGPAYAYCIPVPGGPPIRGLARSVNAQFLFEENLPEEMKRRLVDFLRSLGVGWLKASIEDARQSVLLDDLRGPSDCLSEQAELPWEAPQPMAVSGGA